MLIPAEHLRAYPLLASLSDDELAAIAPKITKRAFAKGAYIYQPGSPGLNMYLVESGLVRMFFANQRGEEFLMNLVTPTDCFGTPLLMDNQARLVGAAAVRDTVVLALAREDVFDGMRRIPQFAVNIYVDISNKMRLLGGYLHGVTTLSVQGRLAKVFLHYSAPQTNELNLPISQGELAGMLASSRGRVNRALANMQAQGLIRMDGQKIYILDRAGLVKTSEV